MSQDSLPSNSSYLPQESTSSNTSRSPWTSQSSQDQNSLRLPPINSDNDYDPFDDDIQQYFDSLPQVASPDPFLSNHRPPLSLKQEPPLSNHQAQTLPREFSQYRIRGYSESPDPFEFLVDLDPPQPDPRHPRSHNDPSYSTSRASSLVDLTETSPISTMPATTRKRKADNPEEGPSSKVVRRGTSTKATLASKTKKIPDDTEVVDLVGLDDDIEYEEFKRKQQEGLIKQQRLDEANRPVKLAQFQCSICLDSPTDLTVTHCGHLFCSVCLYGALYAGTMRKICPICRSQISVSTRGGKKHPKNGLYALEMKLMTAKKMGKQPAK